MTAVILCAVLSILFFILGVFLMNGRGSWLIAGYNTASREEKEKYDEKKLCRSTGIVVFAAALLVAVVAVCGYRVETGQMQENSMLLPVGICIGLVIVSVIGSMVYTNKYNRKR